MLSKRGEFHPLDYPALALQTYLYFGGGEQRNGLKDRFAGGVDIHLHLDYPKLTDGPIDQFAAELEDRREVAREAYGEQSPTVSSIDYRLEEVIFLSLAYGLQQTSDGNTKRELAKIYNQYNERLYGKPDPELFDSILGTIRASYSPDYETVNALWRQLETGFTVELANGEQVVVPALEFPQRYKSLPALTPQASKILRQLWREFSVPLLETQGVYSDVVAVEEGLGDYYKVDEVSFSGERLFVLMRLASGALSEVRAIPEFNVEADEYGTAACWESGAQAVVVGLMRSEAMGRWEKVRGTVAHEATHGIKSVQGTLLGEPALSTGVFTKDAQGSWISYLDFEEGNNKLGESLIMNPDGSDADTIAADYHLQILPNLIYRGYDDRQATEILKRLLAIERICYKPDLAKDFDIEKEGTPVNSLERILRGTPIDPNLLVDGHMLTYNKDLAYYSGKVKAIDFWNNAVERALAQKEVAPLEYVRQIFDSQNHGKIDPTVPEQAVLVGL